MQPSNSKFTNWGSWSGYKFTITGAVGVVRHNLQKQRTVIQLETNTSETPSRDYLHDSRSNLRVQGTIVQLAKNKYANLKEKTKG